MSTCILNISLGDYSRKTPIISSTNFRRDEFFDADTRKYFFDSNDNDGDQDSVLRKIMQQVTNDLTSKLQKDNDIDLRIKAGNFDFTFIDEDGDELTLSGADEGCASSPLLMKYQRHRSS